MSAGSPLLSVTDLHAHYGKSHILHGVTFERTEYDLGAERYLATGEVLPDSVLDEIRTQDAILLGAVGGRPGDPAALARPSRSCSPRDGFFFFCLGAGARRRANAFTDS